MLRLQPTQHLLALSILVGLLAGVAAVLFRAFIIAATALISGVSLGQDFIGAPWWVLVAVPTLGGLASGILIYGLQPDRRPHGVADVVEGLALRGARIPLRATLISALASLTTLSCGLPVGREGPVVHLAAGIASRVGKLLRIPVEKLRTLIGCAVAAGVAASFNAPIAGVFFAQEVVLGYYQVRTLAPVVLASVSGTLVYHGVFGAESIITKPPVTLIPAAHFPLYALLGAASGLVGIAYLGAIAKASRLARVSRLPLWIRPAVAGLCSGVLAAALLTPEVLGIGEPAIHAALNGHLALQTALVLLGLKLALSALCVGFGVAGGVFSPSLFLGAMAGAGFGLAIEAVAPGAMTMNVGAAALVGMGAVAGTVLGAPVSTILIVFEMTGDYTTTVAVMLAVVVAQILATQLRATPFFQWQLAQRDIDITKGRERSLLSSFSVTDLMASDVPRLQQRADLSQVRATLAEGDSGELYVVDAQGRLTGLISILHLTRQDRALAPGMVAGDVMIRDPLVAREEEHVGDVLDRMESRGLIHLPVVAPPDRPGEPGRLLGVIHQREIMAAYHRALLFSGQPT